MKKLSEIIIEEGTAELPIEKIRNTVRGIIVKNQKILMVYSPVLKDYTFPGGGIKPNETHLEALARELKEELGAESIHDIVPYGFIEEKRFGLSDWHHVYLQTSYYYFVNISRYGKQNLATNEITYGVEPIFVDLNQAINQNETIIKNKERHKGMSTVLPRENVVLKSLVAYLNEKI